MSESLPRTAAAALLAVVTIAVCTSAVRAQARSGAQPDNGTQAILTPAAEARADSGRPAYTAADVHFMSGMIGHHAQAVLIAGWAPTHDASQSLRTLCERIVVGQQDEIALMQRWLRERGEVVPAAGASHDHSMPEMDHQMHHSALMPGMLTAEQLARLDSARGPDFDRLFLTFMIQHHEGAIAMVEELFDSHGAAQDDNVFKIASDINADQITEIDRMSIMLAALPSDGDNR